MALKYDFESILARKGTHSVKWDHHEMSGEVADMIPMSIADMDFKAPGFVIDALSRRAAHGVFGYTVVPESYYASVAGWLKRRFDWQIGRDWLRFSPGVIPALNFAVQAFTDPGDKVVIQPPVYHPFRAVVSNNGRVVLNNPLVLEDGRYRMDIEGLRKAVDRRTRMLIMSSPHNPVGRVWEEGELRALAEVCLENNILIVSDEIHADLVMPGSRHIPTASLSGQIAAATVTCTSPSKTFNLAELHVANIVIPDPALHSRFDLALARAGISKPNVMGMVACEAAYSQGDEWVDELCAYLYGNYMAMSDFFRASAPVVKTARMEGTYLGWLDFNGLGLSEACLDELLLAKARVAMTPGRIFGPGGQGWHRMNMACPRAVLIEALERIGAAVRGL